jgi:hypothetical protein
LKVADCFNLKRLRSVAMNCRDHFRLCRNRHFNFVGSVGLAKVACAKRIKANRSHPRAEVPATTSRLSLLVRSQQQGEQTSVALETWHFSQKRPRKVPEEEAGFCDGCHGTVTKSHIQWFSNFDFASCLAQNIRPKQHRQLGDVDRAPPLSHHSAHGHFVAARQTN